MTATPYDQAPETTRTQVGVDLDALIRKVAADIADTRAAAADLNKGYAHSGLTNPRAERLTEYAKGMETVLNQLQGLPG